MRNSAEERLILRCEPKASLEGRKALAETAFNDYRPEALSLG
jgi:hypothetical protein